MTPVSDFRNKLHLYPFSFVTEKFLTSESHIGNVSYADEESSIPYFCVPKWRTETPTPVHPVIALTVHLKDQDGLQYSSHR